MRRLSVITVHALAVAVLALAFAVPAAAAPLPSAPTPALLAPLLRAARGSTPGEHHKLVQWLRDARIRRALVTDLAASRRRTTRKCGLGAPPFSPLDRCRGREARRGAVGIFCALAVNGAPSARKALDGLIRTGMFKQDTDLGDLLLMATAGTRPPTAGVGRLWRRWFSPGSGTANLMPALLLDNASPVALRLYRQRLGDKRFDLDTRRGWLHDLKVRRDHVVMLQLIEKLLADRLPRTLRLELMHVLFTDRPSKSAFPPRPWPKTPPAVQAALRRVAQKMLALRPPAALRQRMTASLAQLPGSQPRKR